MIELFAAEPERERMMFDGAALGLGMFASAAASFLRKEGGLSGKLRIWQSALQ
jgi:hypothetical protein